MGEKPPVNRLLCGIMTEALDRPISVSEATVPVQVCYLVPESAPDRMLSAIFEECHARWGGRETLIVPVADGAVDREHWNWLVALDPDLVYSYVNLGSSLLAQLDRDVMPSVLQYHHHPIDPDNFRPRLDASPIPALSVLPMLANAERWGPPSRLTLVSAFLGEQDDFVADSFGFNPYGPGWALAETVRRYAATCALGSQAAAQRGHEADEAVADATSLLTRMLRRSDTILTMAQLAGTGYADVWEGSTSSWSSSFNIIVGDSANDRLAFWNSRIGYADWQRRAIVAVRVPESRLEDDAFLDALAQFVGAWNTSRIQGGGSWATVRSSSVSEQRLQNLATRFARQNVQALIAQFDSAAACAPTEGKIEARRLKYSSEWKISESPSKVAARLPDHLLNAGPVPASFARGSWAVQLTMSREGTSSLLRSSDMVKLPRRWQAIRKLADGATAKASLSGDLRLIVSDERKVPSVHIVDSDAEFVARLFGPHHYLLRADPRQLLVCDVAPIFPRTSSAGRHLLGLLKRLGGLRAAYEVLGDKYWSSVFNEMAVPREAFDHAKRGQLASRLRKYLNKDGIAQLKDASDFERLADATARVAPDLKTPVAMRPYEWFIQVYRDLIDAEQGPNTDGSAAAPTFELQRDRAEADDVRRSEELPLELRRRCEEGVFAQGYLWKCGRCLHRNWHTVAALAPTTSCEVCGNEERIPVNFSWTFLLDEYVARGLRERGLRALVWALGQLNLMARRSFLFAPPLDLYRGDEQWRETDIACLMDGRFIIGEVKESARQLGATLAEGLVEIATVVRPDVVVLACLDPGAQLKMEKQAEKMRTALEPYNIAVWPILPTGDSEPPFGFAI